MCAGKTLAFLLPLAMRVRALRKQAEEEAAAAKEAEDGGSDSGEDEGQSPAAADASGVKAVVVRCALVVGEGQCRVMVLTDRCGAGHAGW